MNNRQLVVGCGDSASCVTCAKASKCTASILMVILIGALVQAEEACDQLTEDELLRLSGNLLT